MPEVEFRNGANSVEEVLVEFDRRKDSFVNLSKETVRLIETILCEEKIGIYSIQTRVKSRDKLKSKYVKREKNYKCLDDLSDIVGIRIITYYSDSIDRIAEIIDSEFTKCGPVDDKRIGKPESFGYSALHMDCAYSAKRLESTEYKRFAGARFEIQITTVLGHAWAEMHHAWYDSSDTPPEEERRFLRLAAVLELAEQEFLEIRKKKDDREQIASVQVSAESPEIPITPESLKAFIEQKVFVKELDEKLEITHGRSIALNPDSIFLASLYVLVNGVGICSIQDLENKMRFSGDAIIEYLRRMLDSSYFSKSEPATSYYKGHSVFLFASLLAGVLGVDRYWKIIQGGPIILRKNEIAHLVNIAKEVASEFHLSSS